MRILFADPDRELIAAYEKLFRLNGDETVPAYDGRQATELLKKERFDAAVVREELPRCESSLILTVLSALKTPVILLRGNDNDTASEFAVLRFPFLPEELEGKLREAVTGHE